MVLRLFGLKKKPVRPETTVGQGQPPVQGDEPKTPSRQSARPTAAKATRKGKPAKAKGVKAKGAAKAARSKPKAKGASKGKPGRKKR